MASLAVLAVRSSTPRLLLHVMAIVVGFGVAHLSRPDLQARYLDRLCCIVHLVASRSPGIGVFGCKAHVPRVGESTQASRCRCAIADRPA